MYNIHISYKTRMYPPPSFKTRTLKYIWSSHASTRLSLPYSTQSFAGSQTSLFLDPWLSVLLLSSLFQENTFPGIFGLQFLSRLAIESHWNKQDSISCLQWYLQQSLPLFWGSNSWLIAPPSRKPALLLDADPSSKHLFEIGGSWLW